MKNKKTTIAAIAGAAGVILAGVSALLDNDPSTVLDMQGVVGAVGVIIAACGFGTAGVASKDHDQE